MFSGKKYQELVKSGIKNKKIPHFEPDSVPTVKSELYEQTVKEKTAIKTRRSVVKMRFLPGR